MGYRPPKKRYELDFSQTEYAGLEVTMLSTSIGNLFGLQELGEEGTSESVAAMFAGFAKLLASWNVEDDDGQPVPATYAGVLTQDAGFVVAILAAYGQNISQAPPPLPSSSNGGNSSGPVPPGLAAASQSLPSSSAPS